MGSIIARLSESVFLLEIGHTFNNYFSDHRDIALGFATDRFAPLKNKKAGAYHVFPPHFQLQSPSRATLPNGQQFVVLRSYLVQNLKRPWDADSFIYLFAHELLELATGVSHMTPSRESFSPLHAYVITGFQLATFPLFFSCTWKQDTTASPSKMQYPRYIRRLYVPLSRCNHPAPTDVVEYRAQVFKRSSGNFGTAVVVPILQKQGNSKRRSLKMFCLALLYSASSRLQ
jgi:hypothetical protein